MPLTPWQQTVVAYLRKFSDADLQRRSWIDMEGMELPSPVELVCELFDDTGLGDMLDSGEVFSPECDARLRELDRKIADTRFDQPASSLLEDCAWGEVVSISKMVVREIEKIE